MKEKLQPGNRVVIQPKCLQAEGDPPMLVIGTVLELNEARGRVAFEVNIRGGKDFFQVEPADILRRSGPDDEAAMPGGDLLPEGTVSVHMGRDGEEKMLTAREMDYLHALRRGSDDLDRKDMTKQMADGMGQHLANLNPDMSNLPAAVTSRRRTLAGKILCSLLEGRASWKAPEDVDAEFPALAIRLADLLLSGLAKTEPKGNPDA